MFSSSSFTVNVVSQRRKPKNKDLNPVYGYLQTIKSSSHLCWVVLCFAKFKTLLAFHQTEVWLQFAVRGWILQSLECVLAGHTTCSTYVSTGLLNPHVELGGYSGSGFLPRNSFTSAGPRFTGTSHVDCVFQWVPTWLHGSLPQFEFSPHT